LETLQDPLRNKQLGLQMESLAEITESVLLQAVAVPDRQLKAKYLYSLKVLLTSYFNWYTLFMKTTILLLLTQFLEKVNRRYYALTLLEKMEENMEESILKIQWTLASAIKIWHKAINAETGEHEEESIIKQPRMYTLDILRKVQHRGNNWLFTKFNIEQVAKVGRQTAMPQRQSAWLVIPGELVDKHELLQTLIDAGKQMNIFEKMTIGLMTIPEMVRTRYGNWQKALLEEKRVIEASREMLVNAWKKNQLASGKEVSYE